MDEIMVRMPSPDEWTWLDLPQGMSVAERARTWFDEVAKLLRN
jgi:hypothetical protein